MQVRIGERRKPDPQGRPGYLHIDSVHQGDLDGLKGLYHLNAVDEVTQFEIVANIIEARTRAIKTATPLTEDVAVITPHQLLVQALVEQLRVSLAAIERFDTQIDGVAQALPDYALFRALPGAGPTYAPRLLGAFGEQRERYQSASCN